MQLRNQGGGNVVGGKSLLSRAMDLNHHGLHTRGSLNMAAEIGVEHLEEGK